MADMANANMNEAAELSAKELIDSMSDVDKEGLKGWYWYDWANQAYALTVMTVIVPALMANLYNTATGTQSGDGFYALIYGMAMAIVALTAPALGVIADRIPVKKGMLFWYTVAGIVFCAGMGAAPYFGDGGQVEPQWQDTCNKLKFGILQLPKHISLNVVLIQLYPI